METDACDVNQLESDALLPPRKRLLAGLKKQNFNGNGSPSPPPPPAGGVSSSSTSNGSSGSANVQTHLDNILVSHLNDPNLRPEDIAESSRSAAAAAAKNAKVARAAAEEKALIAAKAIAAAKSALELFYSFTEEVISGKDRSPRKNKQKKHVQQKKHVPVELLYSNTKDPGAVDEDLARRLHRAINSSPRVLRTSPSPEGKGHKNKKHKAIVTSENPMVEVGSSVVSGSMFREHDIAGVVDSDSSNDNDLDKTRANEKTPVCHKGKGSDPDNMEEDSTPLQDKIGDESNSLGKRRGRVKLKKLALSICNTKDQENHKEGLVKSSQSTLHEKDASGNRNNGKSLAQPECCASEGVIPVVSGPSWKCQDLKAPECAKQNKAVRS
ncbi:PREDICTED: PHD finger protein 14-like [Tarenaya hassleriana]|uniref:PHD finger protein 14-like n=1 Tax=Tarenaya hassleriana TaxID=28532 RepID=UPI00053C16A2|nr:PREDICTED: PHD finger protein 14-like [Tarenaya hassleriana]XP_010548205.1 PREDICTED: PHD finger protein 14-like [Tarenaya hassleriana]